MLDTVDLSMSLDQETYLAELEHEQTRLKRLARQVDKQQRPVVAVFEGWDDSAKGSIIRHVAEYLDPTGFTVHAISYLSPDEIDRHYLVPFWERLPEQGHIAFFDGSWYTPPLMEDMKGCCPPEEQERAYREINAFERQLVDFGAVVCKFWIHTGRDVQLRRIEEREQPPGESRSIIEQDWFDVARWDDYVKAVDALLLKTSTLNAPWVIIEGNDKYWARVKTLKTLNRVLSGVLLKPSHPLAGSKKPKKANKKKIKKKKK
jgi:polyphosphate kinase 2 (PPK2 family)